MKFGDIPHELEINPCFEQSIIHFCHFRLKSNPKHATSDTRAAYSRTTSMKCATIILRITHSLQLATTPATLSVQKYTRSDRPDVRFFDRQAVRAAPRRTRAADALNLRETKNRSCAGGHTPNVSPSSPSEEFDVSQIERRQVENR